MAVIEAPQAKDKKPFFWLWYDYYYFSQTLFLSFSFLRTFNNYFYLSFL
jgi:hypothetical protein